MDSPGPHAAVRAYSRGEDSGSVFHGLDGCGHFRRPVLRAKELCQRKGRPARSFPPRRIYLLRGNRLVVMPGTLFSGRRCSRSVRDSLEYFSVPCRDALGALSGSGTLCAQTLAPCNYFVDSPFEWPLARPAGGARYPVRSRAREYLERYIRASLHCGGAAGRFSGTADARISDGRTAGAGRRVHSRS